MLKNVKLILLDMDGVLFDSKLNMKLSWRDVQKNFIINKSFKHYFQHVGIPFKNILRKIQITKNLNSIESFYQKSSLKYFNKIKPYPDVKTTLSKLSKRHIALGIFTSKHRKRTLKLIKKFNLKFKVICTPSKGVRGKPYPDQINKSLKKFKIPKKDVVYVGDMNVDFIAAKKSGIRFIYAAYGYGNIKRQYSYTINKFSEINKIIS